MSKRRAFNRWVLVAGGIALLLLISVAASQLFGGKATLVESRLVALAGDSSGYLRAEGPRPLLFPEDQGPHPGYQTEWWYYTGNLSTPEGRRFGYQLTFFRRALAPPSEWQERTSIWATEQVYMAHFALTDASSQAFRASERFSRGAAGLAGAEADPYRVWLEDWYVEEGAGGDVRLHASQEGVILDLVLRDLKGPVLQGDRGYSPKGPQPGNASYYYSLTRLQAAGTVQVAGESYQVSGLGWMDHEFSTSSLAADQVGWDWFSFQLGDGAELMVFQLRKEDGSIDPYSSGTFIAADGSTRHLDRDDFEIEVVDTWRSRQTDAEYPASWILTVPGLDLVLRVEPLVADQELTLSYAYWEGAVEIEGQRGGHPVEGVGYVEMTGYAASMQGQF